MCVSKTIKIHARVTEFCFGNEMQTLGRGTDGRPDGRRTDIRGDANTPRPHFVEQGIKSNQRISMTVLPENNPVALLSLQSILLIKYIKIYSINLSIRNLFYQ